MPALVIVAGIPACGKSTYARQLKASQHYTVVVGTDAIRVEMAGTLARFWERQRGGEPMQDRLFETYHTRIEQGLHMGATVVADATHLRAQDRAAVRALLPDGVPADLVLFANPQQAMLRNAERQRAGKDTAVPEDVMRRNIGRLHETLSSLALPSFGNECYRSVTVISDFRDSRAVME